MKGNGVVILVSSKLIYYLPWDCLFCRTAASCVHRVTFSASLQYQARSRSFLSGSCRGSAVDILSLSDGPSGDTCGQALRSPARPSRSVEALGSARVLTPALADSDECDRRAGYLVLVTGFVFPFFSPTIFSSDSNHKTKQSTKPRR